MSNGCTGPERTQGFFWENKIYGNALKEKISEYNEAIKHASLITGVPGGVGPMTITMLPEKYPDCNNEPCIL
jgi:5,10-methylene-tetrahydrofolate dehydrogenase/methenyl tetrahydrofolate cyclohydrolase